MQTKLTEVLREVVREEWQEEWGEIREGEEWQEEWGEIREGEEWQELGGEIREGEEGEEIREGEEGQGEKMREGRAVGSGAAGAAWAAPLFVPIFFVRPLNFELTYFCLSQRDGFVWRW